MTSNVFVTPRAVATISRGRIDHNSSLQALLQNFYSSAAPVNTSVDLEGELGLQNGMLWRQGGTNPQDGRLFVYDTNSPSHPLYSGYTREGIAYISQNTFVQANAALSNNYFQAGEIVRVKDEDKLYLVNNLGTSLIAIGSGTSTAANIWQTNNTYVYYTGGLNIGVGTAVPSYTMHVVGNVYASVDFITPSDERLKSNIVSISNGLSIVKSLEAYEFNKIGDTELHAGVLAQQLEKILPHLVRTDDSGTKHVVYDQLIAYLIASIKELADEVESLKK